MKNKKILGLLSVIILAAVIAMVLKACPKEQETANKDEVQQTTKTISFTERSYILATGDKVSLSLEQDVDSVTYTSSNPEAVKVSKDGEITALKKGNALITATSGDAVAYCGIMVDLESTLFELTDKKISAHVDRAILTMPSIHQQFVIDDATGDIYFLQKYDDTPSDVIATRYCADGTQEWMRFIDFGHGSGLALEREDDGSIYLWLTSDADVNEVAASVSRILWEPGKVYQEDGGDVFVFPDVDTTPIPYIDAENNLLCVRGKKGVVQAFYYYDLDAVKAGELIPLTSFEIYGGASSDEPLYYSFQGMAVSGQYLYYYEGSPSVQPKISVWDMQGNLVSFDLVPNDVFSDLNWNGGTGYYEPEGLDIYNGQLYLGMASNPGGNRRSSVFVYEK